MKKLFLIALPFIFLTAARPIDHNLENRHLLDKARQECTGSVAFYLQGDSGNVLLKDFNYDLNTMTDREIKIVHALENEMLLVFLKKGLSLTSIECNVADAQQDQNKRIMVLSAKM